MWRKVKLNTFDNSTMGISDIGTNRKVKKLWLVINNLLIPSEAMLTKNGQLHANTHRDTLDKAQK